MAYRTTVILNPHYGRTNGGKILQPHERPSLKLTDFVTVPVIETYGVWSVQDILPKKSVVALAAYANRLEMEGWR